MVAAMAAESVQCYFRHWANFYSSWGIMSRVLCQGYYAKGIIFDIILLFILC